MTLHQRRTHPEPVDGCFACHLATVQIAPSAQPTRHPGIEATKAARAKESRDMAAYQRLRRQGVMPHRGITGAAELETRADYTHEMETGHFWGSRPDRRYAEQLHTEPENLGLVRPV